MINLVGPERCTGCTACQSACPKSAIRMEMDSEGFLQPKIDTAKCVECGSCVRVCPVLCPGPADPHPKCYAFKIGNHDLLMQSTSGGAFSALALPIIKKGGAVFGCILRKPELIATHVEARSEADLAAMRGSKYVQSDLRDTFRQCRNRLMTGVPVLFSGTPCQIAGLNAFLGKRYENLLTVEVLCHGTPSPGLFEKFKADFMRKERCEIRDIGFRHKEPLTRYSLHLDVLKKDGIDSVVRLFRRSFFDAFINDLSIRRSCVSCPSKDDRSGADFSIADFWGVEKCGLGMSYDGEGVSLIIVHSERGERALDELRQNSCGLVMGPVPYDDAVRANLIYRRPTQGNPRRAEFMSRVFEKSFEKWTARFTQQSIFVRIWGRVQRFRRHK